MARNYMTWITTRRAKTLAAAQAITKAGMLDIAITSLGYLSAAVSLVAGIIAIVITIVIAIVPIMLWISFGLLANKLMDQR